MKTRKLIKKFYKAVARHERNKERKLWFKILKKSLKHKRTQAIQ